jgi:glyoxylase-like metal-dependent hydrolase (beta-lactamase superfamily II)
MTHADTTVTGEIAYPFDRRPEPGEAMAVADGVYWLRMPLPFALDHINLWLLDDGDGWTIIDTGIALDETRDLWEEIFRTSLNGKPVRRVLVTHFHPDHMGLAGWLTERWSAPLWTTRSEWLFARMLSLDTSDDMIERQVDFYRSAGCAQSFLESVRTRGPAYARRVSPIPPAFRRIGDGDVIAIGDRRWHVLVGRGHAPEHACLHCPDLGLLISGDQVLPRISPNVGVYAAEPEAEPLSEFLASLDGLRIVPDSTLVLPSHNTPFTGLHRRLTQLAEHHEQRLDDLVAALDGQKSAMEVARVLFRRPLDDHQMGFAIGETLSHLHLLRARGLVERITDTDGIYRYAAVQA